MIPTSSTGAVARKTPLTLLVCALVLIVSVGLSPRAEAALTDLTNGPLAQAGSTVVKPNLLLMMDDSGSMGWTHMPDDADNFASDGSGNKKYGYRSSQCNGVYYNPSLVYSLPVTATGTYPAATFTGAWQDGYNTGLGTVNLSTSFYAYGDGSSGTLDTTYSTSVSGVDTLQPAYYYVYYGTQTTSKQKDYYNTSSTFYQECNALIASPTITINSVTASASVPLKISSITVNGVAISSGTISTTSTSTSGLASSIATLINNASGAVTATVSGSTVTLAVSDAGFGSVAGYSPVINVTSGSLSKTIKAFPLFRKVVVSATSGPGNTDERTNFANWFSYYRTRMNMMKTATGQAFNALDSGYRVGFATMNNNNGSMFLNLAPFDSAQKTSWYTMLYSARSNNSTPLLKALSRAGQLYAHKLSGGMLNGVAANDPMEYSCQQNFTILSTDGFWNDSTNYNLSGGSVGNQDNLEPRPYYDGAAITWAKSTSQHQQDQEQVQKSTSQLQKRIQQVQYRTSTLQKQITQMQTRTSALQKQTTQLQMQTSTLQTSTGTLQKRTRPNSWTAWGAWANAASCTWGSNTQCQYAWGGWSNVATCTRSYSTNTTSGTTWTGNGTNCQYTAWSAWAGTPSCTAIAQDGTSPYTVATAVQCQSAVTSAWASTPSCTVTTVPDGSGQTTQCQYGAWSAWSNAASCTAVAQDSGPNYTTATARQCQMTPLGYSNVASCTATTVPDGSGQTTQCQYSAWTAWANNATTTCTAAAQDTGPSYTTATARDCQATDTGWVGAASCTAGTSGGATTTCQTVTTGPTLVASCTPQTAGAGNSYLSITCLTTYAQNWTPVQTCTPDPATAANSYLSTNCKTVTTGPTNTTSCAASAASATNSWTATTCSYVSSTGGTSNTLADVAEYYYKTDLRDTTLGNATGVLGLSVEENNVRGGDPDTASWQHMTTFTLGLGARGRMVFSEDYLKNSTGDYWAVAHETHPDGAGTCSWQSASSTNFCNWPTPNSSGAPENIDDLWHAAVNGRGSYFSATDPATLVTGLNTALAGMKALLGAGAAATTSNPNVTSGDNFIYNSSFMSGDWTGELTQATLGESTGLVETTGPDTWAAQAKLDAQASRTIYTFDSASTTTNLKPFAWAQLTATEQAYFTLPHIAALSQFCASGATCLNTSDRIQAQGKNLVDYLAGERTHEGGVSTASSNTYYYRLRKHMLGDIVNAEAAYVRKPLFSYTDAGYGAFVTAMSPSLTTMTAGRAGMVYAAANDGMLHAFSTADGSESWAYVPGLVMPDLYKLADENYANLHRYSVDGTPIASDAYFQAPWDADPTWHTILVGGLNAGGRGYYALDVTDPASPKALWEFTDTNMGYTFGNPVIAKLEDGTWVVFVTSGYNNVSPGDGKGHLYALNAATGAIIRDINTGVGSTASPSGLSRISGWVDNSATDNTVLRVYGGDLNGNLWRFDVNDNVGASGYDAQLLVQLLDPSGNPQPITTLPELTTCNGEVVVLVGTGKYLGTTDLANTQVQSFYAVKDKLDATTYGSPRTSGNRFVQQTETVGITCSTSQANAGACKEGQNIRTGTSNTVDLTSGNDNGWYVDFPEAGERLNTDPTVVLGSVVFNTNVPGSSACTPSGHSYRNLLNSCTGAPSLTNEGVISVELANAIATRPVVVMLPTGSFISLSRITDPDKGCPEGTCSDKLNPDGNSGSTRRVSWRELPTDQ